MTDEILNKYLDYSIVAMELLYSNKKILIPLHNERNFRRILEREHAVFTVISRLCLVRIFELIKPRGIGIEDDYVYLLGVDMILNSDMPDDEMLLINDKGESIAAQLVVC